MRLVRVLAKPTVAGVLVALTAAACGGTATADRDDRAALFQYLVDKTVERTAWSPYTPGDPERTFTERAERLRPDFLDADTDAKLFYALVKLSNLRHDRHLSVDLVDGGLAPPTFDLQAPVLFRTDFGTPGAFELFVADVDERIGDMAQAPRPEVGDVLVAVNGRPTAEHADLMEPYIRYSTINKLWWEIADGVSRKSWRFGPEVYAPGDEVAYTLRRGDGTTYETRLRYLAPHETGWTGSATKRYTGFSKALETPTYDLYLPADPATRMVVLDWKRFERSLPEDVDRLMVLAAQRGLLDYGVLFDGTTSGGGSRGAYALARLSARPFKTTFGNLRLSDVTQAFIDETRREFDERGVSEAGDGGARLVEWLEHDVLAALRAGRPYSPNVPFKLAELPKDSDGTMTPAPVHFRGGLFCVFGPSGGSHLDQFAAMVADNELGELVGMSAAGHSNTWEWTETVALPASGRPVASFMWNIGHTIRPTGEILEGNPALPTEAYPVTRENFDTYDDEIIRRALDYFERTKVER